MPPICPAYELIDFGQGRKLERFGPWLLDRPSPGARDTTPADPSAWKQATARYTGDRAMTGRWSPEGPWSPAACGLEVLLPHDCRFELQLEPLPSGQLGVFPEQAANWEWIARQVFRWQGTATDEPLKVLNLFGYTGGSTLAAAAAGAAVTHVDAAKSVVSRARHNAHSSSLDDRPIRWLCEDVQRFCRRELKRGNTYHAIILDPPSFGRGPLGESWSITRDLLPLLQLCRQLTAGLLRFALLTCHTPGIGPAELGAYLADGLFGSCASGPRAGELALTTTDRRSLSSGCYARWPA